MSASLPPPPSDPGYSYLHQSAISQDVKFMLILGVTIVILAALVFIIGGAQVSREHRQYERSHKGLPGHDQKGRPHGGYYK